MQTRRDFLKLAALLSGAGFSGLLPESIQRAYAIQPEPGSTWRDAEHVVILMQENRSFDHTFGTLRGVRGFNDPRALRLPNGNSVFVQTGADGASYAPWRLDIHDTRITWMGSLPHSRESQIDAWNEGAHDGWIEAKRSGKQEYARLPLTMGHYTREDLPFYYSLADAFTVCDQNYCSVQSSTSPNRCYLWTGTIRDSQSTRSRVYMRNEEIDGGGMIWKTFPERLQEAGVRWKSYQNELTRSPLHGEASAWLSNFSDNTLECFRAYNVEAYPGYAPATQRWLAEAEENAAHLKEKIAATNDPAAAAALHIELQRLQVRIHQAETSLPDSGDALYRQLTPEQKALFHAAFVTNAGDPNYHALAPLQYEDQGSLRTMMVPKGDLFYQFRKDVEEGSLPAISWLTAPESFSDHPSSPWYGAWYVSEVMDILTQNPEVWKKTIFLLTYDENDGYFDHAPSFVAADPKRPETGGASPGIDIGLEYTYIEDELIHGVPRENARSGPIGMGFRVPMIVASPWSRGGWVNSQLFDHTSTLIFLERFVEAKYGVSVREENISPWRRSIAGDLTSVFRPCDPREAHLDFVDRDRHVVSIEKARDKEIPSNYRTLTAEQIEQIDRDPAHSSLPRQEEGVRPACALPYELYADGSLSGDGSAWELRLTASNKIHGAASAGAPFNLYLRNLKDGRPMQAATYAVRSGDTQTRKIPLSLFHDRSYRIEVHAPNGFYRSFRGDTSSGGLKVWATCQQHGPTPTGNLEVHLHNRTKHALAITITDHAYRAAVIRKQLHPGPNQPIVLDLTSSHGWYDFTVSSDELHTEARYAGHVETGRPGISDPFMGRVI